MENTRTQFPQNPVIKQKQIQSTIRDNIMQNITNSQSPFHRSIISTSKTKNISRNISNDKSKIKILPNYQKYNLGNNLPFITIFQAIQIQRLSDQIETQRVKIKQFQRCIFNGNNFQIQIKQLSQRCTSYQFEINQYHQQLDKMNKICQTLFNQNQNLKNKQKNIDNNYKNKLDDELKKNKQFTQQIQKWKQKYTIYEQNQQNQLQKIKSMMQKQRRSMIDREIKDMEVKHNSQIQKLSIQIRRLNNILLNKQKDIQNFHKKYINEQDYIKQLKNYNYKINQYQQKIHLLNQEKIRLGQIIDQHANQLDMARKKQYKLTQQLNTQKVATLDNQQLKQLMQQKQRELQNQTRKINQLQQQVIRGRQLIHIISQLQSKYTYMNQQNDKLIKILKQRSIQIQKWQKVAINLEDQNKIKRQIEDKLIQKQIQCKMLQAQQQRIQNINKNKIKQFQQLKNKYQIIQNQIIQLNKLDKQKKNIQDKNKIQYQRILQLQTLIQKLQNQLQLNKQQNLKYRQIQSLIDTLKRQNQILQSKLNQNQYQLTNLKQSSVNRQKQFGKLKEKQIFNQQYKDKINIMNLEITRLTQLLKAKNDEIVSLEDQKINSYTIATQYKYLQNELQDKDKAYTKLKSQFQQSKQKISIYEQRMQQIDQKNKQLFSKLKQQIQMLQCELKQKIKQCQQLKIKQQKIQSQISQKSQLQKLCQKQQNKLTVYLRDLQDLRLLNKQYQSKLTQQKHKHQQQQQRRSTLPQFTQLSKKDSSSSFGKPLVQPSQNSQQILTKINKLQIIVKQLKIKYNDLLKQISGSSCNILADSFHTSLPNLSV